MGVPASACFKILMIKLSEYLDVFIENLLKSRLFDFLLLNSIIFREDYPRIVSVPLSLEQRERLIFLAKHAKHWRERQRAQTILWLSEGKSVAEVATLQERIPETIRLQRRRWELYEFESIKEGHRSGRPNTLISDYQAKILDWVNTSPLNAEQIRVKLHEEYEVSVSVETIRKFLRDSGMVFKRTRHSLKKKRSDCI